MRELIVEKSNNIGSLCSFLRNVKNKEYLDFIESSIPISTLERPLSEKIFYFINDLKDIQTCNCGKHLSFIGFKNGYRPTCGDKKCFVEKRKSTCILKYGVDNPKKSKEVIKKEKENIKKKWGSHYMLNKEVRERFNNTMVSNFGVQWAQQSDSIKEKSIETWKSNVNKEKIINKRSDKIRNKSIEEKKSIQKKKIDTIIQKWGSLEEFKSQIDIRSKETSLRNWGFDHHFKNPTISEKKLESYKKRITQKIIDRLPNDIQYIDRKLNESFTDSIYIIKCQKCDKESEINRQYLNLRVSIEETPCLNCSPRISGTSKMEMELSEFIKLHENNVITNSKSILKNNEIDIYLPDSKLALEFNGLYWHSEIYKDRKYHLTKTEESSKLGIDLFHVWEDDWIYRSDIVKSMILNKMGKTPKRIGARLCNIKEINDNKLVREFLNKNHIQGFVGSSVKIGLFYKDELVSIMTFGNLRKPLGGFSKEGSYEMLRFCSKINTNVMGASSKLFNFFVKNYNPSDIISYSDSSRGSGSMYEKLGFNLFHQTEPNYYWVVDGVRKNRFNFRKDILIKQGFDSDKTEIEIMKSRGYYRIWDCGSRKWTFTNIQKD